MAVVLITGTGRAFSAGNDLVEMQARLSDPNHPAGEHGFYGMLEVLAGFPKPLICAVNGLGVGIGTTILGFADLVFMSATARLKCPFTSLGVAPEAASSYLLPRLIGRQNAAWLLMSSEWIDAVEAQRAGIDAAIEREKALFAELVGAAANAEALAAFAGRKSAGEQGE
jgi:enoyl-CoA hydratase/carnithine racemase